MRFDVLATFRFNKKLEGIGLKRVLEQAGEVLLQGAMTKEQGAQIKNFNVKGNELTLELVTGEQVRGPNAILRLKNFFTKRLGKEFRLGLRGIKARIIVELEGELPDELPGVKVERLENKLKLTFEDLTEADLKQRVVTNVLKRVKKKEELADGLVAYGYLIEQGRQKRIFFDKDPAKYFEQKGYAFRYPGKGQWVFTEKLTRLLRVFEKVIKQEIVKPLGFKEWVFPRLVPLEVMTKMPNYFGHLPEGMFYVTAGGRDPNQFKEFAADFRVRQKPNKELLGKALPDPKYVLDPAQCTNFYQAFANKKVDPKALPVKVFENGGWTWRNEGGAVTGLERTNEFIRFELVYMGYPEQVIKIRKELLDRVKRLADEVFDLEWKVVVGAPFYAVEDDKKVVDLTDPEMVETYDLEAYLPYRGDRGQEWLEINAFNMHGDPFTKNFVLKDATGKRLWTGCTGFGVTRWITAFLAQKGFDTKNWPQRIRRLFEGE